MSDVLPEPARSADRPSGELQGQVVVVTGGAQGIGRAVVDVALREGAAVAALDVDASRLDELSVAAGDRTGAGRPALLPLLVDVTDEAQVRSAVERITAALGAPAVLVNNAGRNSYGDPVSMTTPEWDRVFELDLKAAWLCAKHALPGMLAAGYGSIVNVASVHAHMTSAGMFPYAAAKAGLRRHDRSRRPRTGPGRGSVLPSCRRRAGDDADTHDPPRRPPSSPGPARAVATGPQA